MKIVFPESVERELAEQQQQKQQSPDKNSASTSNTTTPQSGQQEGEQQKQELSQVQLKARNAAIQNTTSSLYEPESPLAPEYRSKSTEIKERLERINKRFAALKAKEELRSAELQRQAWLRYSHLAKPTLSDFKRPITSFFLLASAVYMTAQYSWFALEREQYVATMEDAQAKLVDSLNDALVSQQMVLEQYDDSSKSRKWWRFW